AGHRGAEAGQAQGVLAGVALEVDHLEAGDIPQKLALLGVEGAPAFAKEARLVAFVAVVRLGGGVPGAAVGFVAFLVDHFPNLHHRRRGADAAAAGGGGGAPPWDSQTGVPAPAARSAISAALQPSAVPATAQIAPATARSSAP